MRFDFYERYKTYSNKELLKIVKEADDYQAEAVAVAEQILLERNLTDDEVDTLEKELQQDSLPQHLKEANNFIGEEDSLLEPILHSKPKLNFPKWIIALLAVIAAQYIWMLYLTLKVVVSFFRCTICRFEPFLLIQLFTLTYVPVIFYLVYKRRQWGWILLFADNLFVFLSRVFTTYFLYNFQKVDNLSTLLIPIFIKLSFLVMLWRSDVVTYFGVARETKSKTVLVTLLGSFVFFAFHFWMR